ncbi:MAG: TRAP transporter small permease subunit [Desulfacinum sp.]|nr:TRAP transporter small permease subunit [Desulfacinum sp.]MBC7360581.1 TRAP transporter small permease subunit [Desulfacinum sp.]
MANSLTSLIDGFIDRQGRLCALLILPLCLVVIYEVFMRYLFNAPTTWGFEATTFLYGIHYMLGLAYTELHNGHVKVDIVTARIKKKTAAILAIVTNCVIFLPVMTLLTYWTGRFAWDSTLQMEKNPTSWAPPIWPIKIIMAVSFLFLLLQGISKLVHDIRSLQSMD